MGVTAAAAAPPPLVSTLVLGNALSACLTHPTMSHRTSICITSLLSLALLPALCLVSYNLRVNKPGVQLQCYDLSFNDIEVQLSAIIKTMLLQCLNGT